MRVQSFVTREFSFIQSSDVEIMFEFAKVNLYAKYGMLVSMIIIIVMYFVYSILCTLNAIITLLERQKN